MRTDSSNTDALSRLRSRSSRFGILGWKGFTSSIRATPGSICEATTTSQKPPRTAFPATANPLWLAGKSDKNDLLESSSIARLAASDAGACYTQEVPPMLLAPTPRRKHSARDPFRAPVWDDQQPDFQRLDTLLPADHHARCSEALLLIWT